MLNYNNLNMLTYCYQILNMQIERQNALQAKEYLYMALNQTANQILMQSFLLNTNKACEQKQIAAKYSSMENINNNIIKDNSNNNNFNYSFNKEENLKKEEIQKQSQVNNDIKSSVKQLEYACNKEGSHDNTNIDSKEGKIFNCKFDGCSKKFEYKWILDRHVNSHFSSKLFKCEFGGCEKAYKSKENLNLHTKNKHLGLKPYGCKFCSSRFSHRNGNKLS